ncbi:MAG: hypothetical protein ACE5HS_12100 [bacterium]
MSEQFIKIKNVKRKYEQKWMAMPGVVGVGIGMTSGEVVGIIVSVKEDKPQIRAQIPQTVEGIPVEIQLTGEFKAL